ncbi:mitochondrial import inner membrane translocase subunit tim16-like [Tubulanus polymorphus]|uniref:mitochondrial import inner membrane translocase subunit tim16-like n=1 Tax=Tubulanus polymorphus TaxID=672921 RepID=UPI003DA482A6
MAKYIAQIIVLGAQVVGRAFTRALKQEITYSQQAAASRRNAAGNSQDPNSQASNALHGLSLDEAKKILHIDDIQDAEELQKKYEHLFNVNEKKNGGSLYIQSKVVRAKERIDEEITNTKEEESPTDDRSKTKQS